MCSIGGALLHGVKSSPMRKASMLDNVTVANKIVHQSVGGSIATALRDHRQSCVMPIQPNRSLPVHPAPHHTHCRGNNMVKTPSSLVRTTGLISSSASSPLSTENEGILQGRQEASVPNEVDKKFKNGDTREDTKFTVLDSKKDKKSGKNDKVDEEEENNARVDRIENGLIEGLNDLSRKRGHSDWRKKIMWNRENRMENDLIDITRSPERKIVDLCTDVQTDEPNFFSSSSSYIDQINLRHKKKRRRRTKKNSDESSINDAHLVQGHPSKTVPPLRLKKVQSLRELQSFICQSSNPPRINSQFRFDDTRIVFPRNENFRDIANFEDPGKYRIVTGHTPPCDDQPTDFSNLSKTDIASLDAAKLKYKKSKLVLKLGQLKTKTIELGNEMLRTVLSSPNGPHTKKELQIRQKLNRYKAQIGNLEKLLSELPEAVSYPPEHGEDAESRGEAHQTEDSENVCTSTRFGCGSNSSSRRSSPSLEPPELSPKFPTYYESSRSPSELRNSPPILPPAYVTLTDCTDDSSDGKNTSSRRCENDTRRGSSGSRKKCKSSTFSSPRSQVICQETIKSDADDIFDLNDDEEIIPESNSASSTCLEENHLEEVLSNSSIDVMEIYEDSKCAIETKDDPGENIEILESIVKRSPSPILIDKTCLDTQETKPIELRIIDDARVESTDTLYEIDNSDKEKREKSAKDLATHEISNETSLNDLPICEQFPTLANWIATWSKKQTVEDEPKLPDVPVVVEPPTEFQVLDNPESVKPIAQDVQQKPARASVAENSVPERWRSEPWQEQHSQRHHQPQQQQQPLLQSYSTPNVPLPHSQPPPPLTQDVCSPIAMAGFYARNYLDHCSMAYSYNPTIAAAASLWNSAAILQYPLMRPASSALLNSTQPPRISPGNVQFSGSGGISQRSSYRVGATHHNEAKRMRLDGVNPLSYVHRDPGIKMHGNIVSSSIETTKRSSEYQQSAGQARVSLSSGNSEATSYRNPLPHPQEQQYARAAAYGDSRLPISGAAWRTAGHLLGPIAPDYNYATINGWSTNNAASLLNPRNPNPAPSFIPPTNILSSNLGRSRLPKVTADSNLRNCATPNLGKVRSSPSNTGNYECSNCGRVGPMFKCLGCEVVFYCDKHCQACHWSRHVKSCPKKMPELKKVVH